MNEGGYSSNMSGPRRRTKDRVIISRFVHMRGLSKKTQKQFSEALAEVLYQQGIDTIPASVSISQWETGAKPIPTKYVDAICQVFGCTKEFLYGKSSNPYSSELDEDISVPVAEIDAIEIINLHRYDKCPVFVVFENYQYPNGWGIVNLSADKLILSDAIIKLSSVDYDAVAFYPMKPLYIPNIKPDGSKKLDLVKALNADYVYIIMNSPDKVIRSMYDGVYHHNENRTAFINAIGLTLPYEGMNKSYTVYEDIGSSYY